MRSNLASVLAMATTVSAHTLMYGVWVNGVDQGDGRGSYIRSPPNNSPVKDLESPDIVCNVNGATPVADFVKANAGDKLDLEWYHNSRGDDVIDASHQGPVITYIAPYTEGDVSEPIWSKIAEEGIDGVKNLLQNGGKAEVVLPAELKAGRYLVRSEIIAHHESDVSFKTNPNRGAQLYPSCFQVEITSGGNAVPDQNFAFVGGYTYEDKGLVGVNIYGPPLTDYQIPGPEVWKASSVPSNPSASSGPSVPSATSAPAIPSTTLSTVINPAPTTTPQPPAPQPTAQPPAECSRKKRSLRSKKVKRSARARRA